MRRKGAGKGEQVEQVGVLCQALDLEAIGALVDKEPRFLPAIQVDKKTDSVLFYLDKFRRLLAAARSRWSIL